MGDGGLSVGPGDADQLQFPLRVAVPGRGHPGQRRPCIVHLDTGNVFGQVPGHFFHQQGGGAPLQGRGNIGVAIAPEAADGHKQAAGRRLPGVIANTGDVRLAGAGHARGRDLPQQIL